jgi:tetratricopeptide (TPR) repeat protein
MQIYGFSVAQLGYPKFGERCLRSAISMAEEQSNTGDIAFSYGHLARIFAEQGLIDKAEENFAIAFATFEKMADSKARARAEFTVRGHYAKFKYQQQDFQTATANYKLALTQAKQANIKQKLALSELYKGLGECLMEQHNKQQAIDATAMAVKLEEAALASFQERNAQENFSATDKTSKELLEFLKCCFKE